MVKEVNDWMMGRWLGGWVGGVLFQWVEVRGDEGEQLGECRGLGE